MFQFIRRPLFSIYRVTFPFLKAFNVNNQLQYQKAGFIFKSTYMWRKSI